MKFLYFWCDIVTPHWLHTLQEVARILEVEVVVISDSLALPSERKVLGWDKSMGFINISFRLKQEIDISSVPAFAPGYHLICNPFNNSYNRALLAVLRANGIHFGLQQSKPGLISSVLGRILRVVGYGVVFRKTVGAASYVLCHGDMCRRFLIKTVGHRQKLFSSGYFVPSSAEIRRKPKPVGENLRGVFLGQFIARKRVIPFAEALLADSGARNIHFDFIGGGALKGRLESIWPTSRGRILPPVAADQVIPVLAGYDVLVLPSAADEWGVVVNEAIHAGCAIITTRFCGSSDLVHHSGCGIVVKTVVECVDALRALDSDPRLLASCQEKSAELSPRITSRAGAQYLAKVIGGLEYSEGPGACLPPWILSRSSVPKLKLAVIYHFFAHYRFPIIRELMDSDSIELSCYGSPSSENIDASIEPLTLLQLPSLNVTPVFSKGGFLWQRRMILPLLRADGDVFIFLASPYFLSTWVAAILLRVKGARVLFWGHLRYKVAEKWYKKWFRKVFYKLATGWLCYGHTAKAELIQNGIPEAEIHVIYNSLDYKKHVKLRTAAPVLGFKHPFPDAEGFFICVSRLVEKRRLDMLFCAMQSLQAKGHHCRVLLVGDGPFRGTLEELAGKMKLDVYFFGACYDESVLRELYRGAVATVAPGEVGLTAIQSLAFGVPVITHSDMDSQMPEAESVVEGVTGWLFKKENTDDMVCAMERALGANRDAMQRACYRMIDLFFNPKKQVEVIRRSSLGLPAKDHDWQRFIKEIRG